MDNRVITLEEFKARFDNSFKIQTSRWDTDVALWLTDAFDDIGNPRIFPLTDMAATVSGYKTTLPQGVALLLGVLYDDDVPIGKVDYIDPVGHSVMTSPSGYYEIMTTSLVNNIVTYSFQTIPMSTRYGMYYCEGRNNDLEFTFDAGSIRLIFHSIGLTITDVVIPNIYSYIEACKFFVLRKLLQYGYKHPIFTLDSNNPYTNVNILYEGVDGRGGFKRRARNDSTKLDHNVRLDLANMTRIGANLATQARAPYKSI